MSTKPKTPRSATSTPAARKRRAAERESAPIPVNNGTVLDPRAPWPFPISVGTEKIKE